MGYPITGSLNTGPTQLKQTKSTKNVPQKKNLSKNSPLLKLPVAADNIEYDDQADEILIGTIPDVPGLFVCN